MVFGEVVVIDTFIPDQIQEDAIGLELVALHVYMKVQAQTLCLP